jgi:hypothetical protein
MIALLRAALVALTLVAFGAAPALAQQVTPVQATSAPAPASAGQGVFTIGQLAAIGSGALGGLIVVDMIGAGGLGTLAGVIAGAYVGNWLYWNPPQPSK